MTFPMDLCLAAYHLDDPAILGRCDSLEEALEIIQFMSYGQDAFQLTHDIWTMVEVVS